MLALKKNQGPLYAEVVDTFEGAQPSSFEGLEYDFQETVGQGHGRIETRRCWVISEPELLDYLNEQGAWQRLSSVVIINAKGVVGEAVSVEKRYYLSSLRGSANKLLEPQVLTGASKTVSIGCWTLPSMKTTVGLEGATLQGTWRSYDT